MQVHRFGVVRRFRGSLAECRRRGRKMEPGTEFPYDPKGTCVFFKDGMCSIHAVKPFQCREIWHESPPKKLNPVVAKEWESHQGQIETLLGREPVQVVPMLDGIRSILEIK